jgi:hypothetical protein
MVGGLAVRVFLSFFLRVGNNMKRKFMPKGKALQSPVAFFARKLRRKLFPCEKKARSMSWLLGDKPVCDFASSFYSGEGA